MDNWYKDGERMTIQEAIEHGKEQLDVFGGEHAEFIEMAIEALEKQKEYRFKEFSIGETLVDASKCHITEHDALEKIRTVLRGW